MLNKKKLYWFSQIFGWLIYVCLAGFKVILEGRSLDSELIISQLVSYYLIGISISHIYRAVIIKLNWSQYNFLRLAPRLLVGTITFGITAYFLQSLVDVIILKKPLDMSLSMAFSNITNWSLLCLLWSLLYFLFHFLNNYKQEEIKNLKWQAAKNEIELNKLKSQLNPHFIFNSMNSIRALVEDDPTLAKNAITQLSNVLRNSLLMGKKKLISFSEEMKLVDDYLSLEKTRFEERLIIVKSIEKNTETFLVPPLMIQTLVENGIKHGTSKLPKGGSLQISAQILNENLEVTIYNSGEYDKNHQSETGFGLVNTKQRLLLMYGNEASFNIKNIENQVQATLIIPRKTIL